VIFGGIDFFPFQQFWAFLLLLSGVTFIRVKSLSKRGSSAKNILNSERSIEPSEEV
jgi:hypothetical protein